MRVVTQIIKQRLEPFQGNFVLGAIFDFSKIKKGSNYLNILCHRKVIFSNNLMN